MTDRGTDTDVLRYVRVFEASRELVFRCMVEPEHLARFWGPVGMTTPLESISVDLRPGGEFATVMVNESDGTRYEMRAVYDEIVEPERLAWTDPTSGMRSVSDFTDLGDGRTEVTITQSRVPAHFQSPEAQAGFKTSLDKFAAYLSELSANTATP
ncbi:MAG: hypothetical protein JWP14_2692 [Frankiales bacterium]|jgi:uncharacterized protein YndB with AHSA1/START domain|nr:hypothetical protein [Frankiales bacterium]